MDLRPGYEVSEVGVIPKDWNTDTLLSISRQIMDFRGRTPKKLRMEWGGGDIPALSAGNVRKGFIDLRQDCYFGSEQLYCRWMTKGDLAKDDIVFTTEAPLGNVALVPDNRRYILSQRTVLLQVDADRISSRFLYQVMLSDGFQRMLADYASGSTARGIQRKTLEQLYVPIPSLDEQNAINAALGDVDELLDGLHQLIAKKRDLRQAVMQQLLTGRRRLPGFAGDWKCRQLGDVLTVCYGKNQHDVVAADGPYPVLASGGQIGTASRPLYDKASVLIGRKGTIDQPQYLASPFWAVDTLFYTAMKKGNCAKFFYYRFCLIQWTRYNESTGLPSLNAQTIESIEISCPEPPEQTAISAVLSDMDAEIAALEARRDKTLDLKQAMMQELLTGRTRLVEPGSAHA